MRGSPNGGWRHDDTFRMECLRAHGDGRGAENVLWDEPPDGHVYRAFDYWYYAETKDQYGNILDGPRMAELQSAFERRDFTNLPRCAECFKHGGESHAFNDVLTSVQILPSVAKDVVRKVIDVRYRS